MKILHLNSSTRHEKSESLHVTQVFLETLKQSSPTTVDTLDLFDEPLPEFDQLAVGAKMALFAGSEATAGQKSAWEGIRRVFDRFAAADAYVINTPLWNNGVPYKLKQFIDIVTQPGWAFGFDPKKGYSGLLNKAKALVVQASGVFHPGISPEFGSDFSRPYLVDWLQFIGTRQIDYIHVAPTVVNPDFQKTRREAVQQVRDLAANWASSD